MSDRDRGLIIAHLAASRYDPRALTAAESLAKLYPHDVEILTRAGAIAPQLDRTVTLLNAAIAFDSAAANGEAAACRVCESFQILTRRYESAGATGLAHATVDRWLRFRPGDYQPQRSLAELFVADGRRRDAELALRRADSLGAPHTESILAALDRNLRLDDLDSANSLCARALPEADSLAFLRLRARCVVALRTQGRLLEALALTHDGRVPGTTIVRAGFPIDTLQAATLDLEMSRFRVAARAFSAIASSEDTSAANGTAAHRRVRAMTLAAVSEIAGADTIRARQLADSIELVGHRSLDPRDWSLHHFVRGLLLAAAKHDEESIPEFREAIGGAPVSEWPRINEQFARSALALSRPADAIAVLEPALRSGIGGANASVTRTDLHALIGDAFVAADLPDSATVHYAIVARAWREADSAVAQRYARANAFLLRTGARAR